MERIFRKLLFIYPYIDFEREENFYDEKGLFFIKKFK